MGGPGDGAPFVAVLDAHGGHELADRVSTNAISQKTSVKDGLGWGCVAAAEGGALMGAV